MKYALGNMLNGAGGFNPDGLSLDLQFAADKTLTARKGPTPVFTRASTATFVGSNGLIQSAAVDAARFDHDPITRACKGLLIEEARTNLLLQSENLGTTWTLINATVSSNVTVAPDGNTTADKVIENTANADHGLTQAFPLSIGASSFSCYAKKSERVWIRIFFGGLPNTWFNLDNGTIGTVGAGVTAAIVDAGNGWYRCSVSGVRVGAGPTLHGAILATGNGIMTYAGDGTSGIFLWGAQLEAGSFPTSYIPTEATALTRSADVCSITGSNFTGMYNQTEGAMLVDAFTPASGIRKIVTCTALFSKEVTLLTNVSAAELEVVDGVSQVDVSSGSPISPNTAFKLACAYKLNDFALTKNGVAPQTDTSGTVPTVDTMIVGSGPAGNTMCGCVSSLRYYKKRLSDAKLQTLTT
jgi:hypothetical protein